MRHRDVSGVIGLGLSLVAHALLCAWVLEADLDTRIYLPPLVDSNAGSRELVLLPASSSILPIPPLPPPQLPPMPDALGDPRGAGQALNSSPGELPMQAREGTQDQAWLSRDPVGPGLMTIAPSPSTLIPGEGGSDGTGGSNRIQPAPPVPPRAAPAAAPAPVGVAAAPQARPVVVVRLPDSVKNKTAALERLDQAIAEVDLSTPAPGEPLSTTRPVAARPPATRPIELAPIAPATQPIQVVALLTPPSNGSANTTTDASPSAPVPPIAPTQEEDPFKPQPGPKAPARSPATPATPPPSEAPSGGQPGRPGPPVPAANPAPMSDTESDPFSRAGSVSFRPGRTDARLGRGHKLVRPRLTTKAQLDLATVLKPVIVLKISIDNTGKVTDVEILRSSGSNEIDLPVRLAMYQSWFEPRKDDNGHLLPDQFPLEIRFY